MPSLPVKASAALAVIAIVIIIALGKEWVLQDSCVSFRSVTRDVAAAGTKGDGGASVVVVASAPVVEAAKNDPATTSIYGVSGKLFLGDKKRSYEGTRRFAESVLP